MKPTNMDQGTGIPGTLSSSPNIKQGNVMPDEHYAYFARRVIAEDQCVRDASCDAAAAVHRRLAKAYRMRLRALAHGAMKRLADDRQDGAADRGHGAGHLAADPA